MATTTIKYDMGSVWKILTEQEKQGLSECPPGLEMLHGQKTLDVRFNFVRVQMNKPREYALCIDTGEKVLIGREQPSEDKADEREFTINLLQYDGQLIFKVHRETRDSDLVSVFHGPTNGLLARVRQHPQLTLPAGTEQDAPTSTEFYHYAVEDESGHEVLHGLLPCLPGDSHLKHHKDIKFPLNLYEGLNAADLTSGQDTLKTPVGSIQEGRYQSFHVEFPTSCLVKTMAGILALMILVDISFSHCKSRPSMARPWYRKLLCQ